MPLSLRKFGHRLNMGKCCHHDSDFNFYSPEGTSGGIFKLQRHSVCLSVRLSVKNCVSAVTHKYIIIMGKMSLQKRLIMQNRYLIYHIRYIGYKLSNILY